MKIVQPPENIDLLFKIYSKPTPIRKFKYIRIEIIVLE